MTIMDTIAPNDLVQSARFTKHIASVEQSVSFESQVEPERIDEKECLLPKDVEKSLSMKTKSHEEPELLTFKNRATIVIMCVVNFFCFVNFSILAPIFPTSAMEKGMSQKIVGFVIGLYNLVMFLTAPVIGTMISRVGVKFAFVSGALFSATCAVMFGFLEYGPSGITYTVMCFVIRGSQALGCAAFQTASYSIIAQLFPHRVSTYFSLLETFAGLGLMTGPPIGGVLYQFGGYYLPFCVTGGALALSGIFVWVTLSPIKAIPSAKQKSLWFFVVRPGALVVLLTMITESIAMTFFEPTLATYLKQFGLEAYQTGFVFLIIPGLYAISGPIVGIIGDKRGYLMTMMITGTLLSGVAYIFIAPPPFFGITPSLWSVIAAHTVIGLIIAMAFVPIFGASLVIAVESGYPDNLDTNGMVSGVLLSAYAFGGFVGASSGGVLVETVGFSWSVFTVGCLLLFNCSMLVVYALFRRSRTNGRDIFDRKRALEMCKVVKYEEI